MRARVAIGVALALAAPLVGAQSESDSTIGSLDFSSMALSLGVVIALIVAAAFVLKRTPLAFSSRSSGPLRVVATLPLGPRERLMLVAMHDREVLVGVSPAGVSIAAVGGDVAPADTAAPIAGRAGNPSSASAAASVPASAGATISADEVARLARKFRAEPAA